MVLSIYTISIYILDIYNLSIRAVNNVGMSSILSAKRQMLKLFDNSNDKNVSENIPIPPAGLRYTFQFS